MSDLRPVLGIDLGTTFSAMSVVDKFGKPVIIQNSEGHPTTPSVVHFYEPGGWVVGEQAAKMVVADPANVVRFIKRAMGDPDYELEFFGKSYTPQEISALILQKLKEDAQEALGQEITDAVITVPAYFNSAQRGATTEAGQIAGLNVLSIINEPTAAAIAYGLERIGGNRKLMVFDLGGGTFDVTLMEIQGTRFQTIASDGNAELGGKDWDDRLLNHVAEQFVEKYGHDPRDEPQPYQELYERCLYAKISLSSKPRAIIPINYRGNRLIVKVTDQEFEALTADLVEQCMDTCRLVMQQAKQQWTDLEEILLVGGSTRMPMIQNALKRLTGRKFAPDINPDESVALGAALTGVLRHQPEHPGLKSPRQQIVRRAKEAQSVSPEAPAQKTPPPRPPGLPQIEIRDVTTHPLGIIVLDRSHQERVLTLIRAATPVPCEKSKRFGYAYDNTTAVRVEVTEGTGRTRDEVEVVGEVILHDLPPRAKGTPLEVVYRYDVNQILEVYVIDIQTGKKHHASINLKGSLKDGRLQSAQREIAQARIH
ncbi:MAG: Hsp70 family protein [Myxococcota bacterium]